MASFICHVFGGTKRFRLERIVRRPCHALRQGVHCSISLCKRIERLVQRSEAIYNSTADCERPSCRHELINR